MEKRYLNKLRRKALRRYMVYYNTISFKQTPSLIKKIELGALLIQLRYCKISDFHLCSFVPEVNSGQALIQKNQKIKADTK